MKPLCILLVIASTWIFSTQAKAIIQNHCFENHIQESIKLNQKIKAYYSNQTNKESDPIFNFLILGEKTALIGAKYFDREAKKFQNQGQDLFCQEFVSMNFNPKKIESQTLPTPQKFFWKKYSRLLKREIRLKDFEAVKDYSLEALKVLELQPQYHCFTRHLLESIYRFAYFAQVRERHSLQFNLDSPKELLARAMEFQRLGLWGAHRIDEMSLPIQIKGIPLLCEQLPPLLEGIL